MVVSSALIFVLTGIAGLTAGDEKAQAATTTTTVIPYQDTGWKYDDVATGADDGFQASSFDDSGWSTGQAAFGSVDPPTCAVNDPTLVHTNWDLNTDMLIRRHFTAPPGTTSLHLDGTVDNNADIYLNGALLGHVDSGNCVTGAINLDIPVGDLTSDNVLAIRGTDIGVADYLDVQLTAIQDVTLPTPLPDLDGGTFIGFWHTNAGFEECTNAFNVIRPNGQRFSLTAKHCIDGNDPNFDQRTNEQVAALQPMNITTDNVGGGTSLTNTLRIATAMDCAPPSSPITPPSTAPIVVGTQLSPGGNCILPSDNPMPTNGDMIAFKPDSPTTVSAQVQTKQGVLPVLDSETIKQVDKKGDELCHWGAGSARNLKTPEHCGSLKSATADSAGMYFFKAKGVGGDSGGPVYVYKYNKKGKAVGVYAVGMVLSAGQVCNRIGTCHDEIGFVPLSTILAQLGVTLATNA